MKIFAHYRCRDLIGNPVEYRSGPAAVTEHKTHETVNS